MEIAPCDHAQPARAVILAAGLGGRLGAALTAGGPKCLVQVGGRSLLEHQLASLAAAGVRDVLLVVGHAAEQVRRAAADLGQRYGVRPSFTYNDRYQHSNTLYSQYLAREALQGPCLCLNGDVLFPASLIPRLLAAPGEAVLAVDIKRCGAEEVKVVAEEGCVIELGKALDPERCHGEFIGVARYGAAAGRRFAAALEAEVAAGQGAAYFERALARLIGAVPLRILPLLGEAVIEIDFPEDHERAVRDIWPRLSRRAAEALP